MFANYSKIPIKLAILLVGFGLLVAGCDSTGSVEQEDGPILKVTNDLGERMTTFEDGESNAITLDAPKATSKFSLKAVSQIDPPTNSQIAGHLSASGDDIFVGYKVEGSSFGGGIDILDKRTPTNLTQEDNALLTPDLDVQEVAYEDVGSGNNNLYIGGAIDFGKFSRDFGNTPAVMIRTEIQDNGNVATNSDGDALSTEAAMPGNLVKSVSLAASGDGGHNVYAVTDGDKFFEFNSDLNNVNQEDGSTQGVLSGVEFRSVAATSNRSLALTRDGSVLQIDQSGGFLDRRQYSSLGPNGIARINSHAHTSGPASGTTLAYVALNDDGLAVVNASALEERARVDDEGTYVSVTAQDFSGFTRVYAAGPNGTIDVFEHTSAITSASDAGLKLQASFNLGDIEEVGTGSGSIGDAQVNQILAEGDFLYIAASNEGVVVLETCNSCSSVF